MKRRGPDRRTELPRLHKHPWRSSKLCGKLRQKVALNKAARNERIKLTATWLNGPATAALADGCFAPFVTSIMSTASIALTGLNVLVMTWLSLSVSHQSVGRHDAPERRS